jgi:hypothetical protein
MLFLMASCWRDFLRMARRRGVNRRPQNLPVALFKQGGSRAPQHRRTKSGVDLVYNGRNRPRAMQQ